MIVMEITYGSTVFYEISQLMLLEIRDWQLFTSKNIDTYIDKVIGQSTRGTVLKHNSIFLLLWNSTVYCVFTYLLFFLPVTVGSDCGL